MVLQSEQNCFRGGRSKSVSDQRSSLYEAQRCLPKERHERKTFSVAGLEGISRAASLHEAGEGWHGVVKGPFSPVKEPNIFTVWAAEPQTFSSRKIA